MALFAPLPPTLPFHHLAVVIGTWFWFGRLRPAPGTWGSLAALPFAWALLTYGGRFVLLGAALAVFILGVWAARVFAAHGDNDDPQSIVVDEVVGQWIALLAAPVSIVGFAIAFFAFRAYDILKPWPVSTVDRNMKNPWGVMLDDVLAGIYALIVVFLVDYWILSRVNV